MALKTAMIDVGGGFRAIFGCGIMDRMLEDGIDVDMCYGVSAGAANMTSFIARQHGRNHTFYTRYAFRKEYASAESFLRNHNFANLDYIYGTLSNHDGENPLDFAAFEANPTGFTVVACNAEDGSLRMRYKTYNDELELAKHYEAEGKVLILAPEDLYGLNTLKKNFEGLEMMYRKGYAAAEAIPAFLQA